MARNLTPSEWEIMRKLSVKLFPSNPKKQTFFLWLIRIIGVAVLSWFGIDVAGL